MIKPIGSPPIPPAIPWSVNVGITRAAGSVNVGSRVGSFVTMNWARQSGVNCRCVLWRRRRRRLYNW